jgi:ribosomal protein S18 acetylase RimI-like enzyme
LLNAIAERAQQQNNDVLTLNVNRDNSALYFYEKMGFLKIGEENIPIGNGYLMEDFILEKKL